MLDNKAAESSQSKLTCSDVTKLLVSIGDQFKKDSKNVAMNIDTLQIGEDLEELWLITPKNNIQEVFVEAREFGAMQTSLTQRLDKFHELPVGWRIAWLIVHIGVEVMLCGIAFGSTGCGFHPDCLIPKCQTFLGSNFTTFSQSNLDDFQRPEDTNEQVIFIDTTLLLSLVYVSPQLTSFGLAPSAIFDVNAITELRYYGHAESTSDTLVGVQSFQPEYHVAMTSSARLLTWSKSSGER
jgi:hypothetical protein